MGFPPNTAAHVVASAAGYDEMIMALVLISVVAALVFIAYLQQYNDTLRHK